MKASEDRWMLYSILFALISTQVFALNPDDVAGVYKRSFKSGSVASPGEPEPTFMVEDILELVKVSNDSMYFKTKLNFYNGHECLIFGMARVDGSDLIYKKDDCTLKLKISKAEISFNDVDGHCEKETCGSRGGYGGAKFLMKQRRPIRYMKRLTDSEDYKKSLTEFSK